MVSFEDAKAFLLQSDTNGSNLYDHLSDVLLKLIESRPAGALQNFENISNDVKASRLPPSDGPSQYTELQDDYFDDKLATAATSLFKSAFPAPTGEGEEVPTANDGEVSDIVDEAANFEWAGVSLGREETFRLSLAIKQLVESNPLKSARFFGKIFGRDNDYYIAESEYKEGFPEEKPAEENANPEEKEDGEEEEDQQAGAAAKKPSTLSVPVEATGKGTNSHTYWVTSTPGEPWIKLPPVTPEQITAARSIVKIFTGHLDHELKSYPAFPGKEINYLRAQIARIGAATVISPKGYYTAEDDEDSGEIPPVQVNADFEGITNADLLSSASWVHHQAHILQQGRAQFVSLKPPKDEDAEDEDEDKPEDEEQVETGPKLLTEIAADNAIGDKVDAWTIRASSTRSKFSNILVRSNRWPGAYAFGSSNGTSVKFANIYIGFGQKYSAEPYSPPFPPAPQSESEAPKETTDPTTAEEAELEKLLKAQEEPEKEEAEEGEEEEEEEEED